jgi:YidC/Oxa1 family membrane protein insertase
MYHLFTLIFLQPILNLLVWLYNVVPGHDIGIAIILLTIIVKAILYPLTAKQIKQQRALQEVQPKIQEVREKFKNDKEAQARELMQLYSREKVNPAASCLPLLIQLPVFIALYQALTLGLGSKSLDLLYSFVANPQSIDTRLFGFLDLSHPNYFLAIAAALVQFVQTRQILKPPANASITSPPPEVAKVPGAKDEAMATMMNKQMMYLMPIMTAFIGFSLPGGLTLYWLVMSLLTVLQQWWFLKQAPPKMRPQLQ